MKEFEVIGQLQRQSDPVEGVYLGIGDDTAILEPGRFDLVTVDTLVEGVHFKRAWSTPEAVGWKLLACNLSDVASMGGAPGPYLVAMTLNGELAEDWIGRFFEGVAAAASAFVPAGFDTGLIGGDTTHSEGPLVISLTLLGEAPPAGAVRRDGATPGDRICLIGAVGEAAAGLALLSAGDSPFDGSDEAFAGFEPYARRLIGAHLRPSPQVKAGALLGLHGLANAMIDVSDGLAQDLSHILRASRVGARLHADRLPIGPELRRAAADLEADAVEWALSGGEDFALVCSVSPDRAAQLWDLAREHGFAVHDIGEVRESTEGFKIVDVTGAVVELSAMGYEHEFGRRPEDG